jgi:hypothetical protein
MGILTTLLGRRRPKSAPVGHMTIDEDFVDIYMPIDDCRIAHTGAIRLRARGTIRGRIIACVVELDAQWRKQANDDLPFSLWWGSGRIRTCGLESDALLAVLAEAYGLPAPGQMALSTRVTFAALNCDPQSFATGLAHIKTFFEHNGTGNYAEAFLKLDIARGIVGLCDKDPDYHAGLLASLSGAS